MDSVDYFPDKWVLLKLSYNDPEEDHYRIFCSWAGGYLTGDSWRINSGITKVDKTDDYYDIHSNTGSVYRCLKDYYGTRLYGESVLDQMIRNSPHIDIVVFNEQDAKQLLDTEEQWTQLQH